MRRHSSDDPPRDRSIQLGLPDMPHPGLYHSIVQIAARLRMLLLEIGNNSTFAASRSSRNDHAGDPFATANRPPHRPCNSTARSTSHAVPGR